MAALTPCILILAQNGEVSEMLERTKGEDVAIRIKYTSKWVKSSEICCHQSGGAPAAHVRITRVDHNKQTHIYKVNEPRNYLGSFCVANPGFEPGSPL